MPVALQGREAELAALRARLQALASGRGGLVVVRGAGGIGKSALVEAIAAEAEGLGIRTLVDRAWELAEAPAYFPVRGGLRALGLTSVAALSEADAFGLWEAVLEALALTCARSPVVWIVEDLHAADQQTLELLAFLAQPLRGIGALVIATVRTGQLLDDAVIGRLNRLVRDGSVIDLQPLHESDVRALASDVAGWPIGRTIGPWMERTGGNPLFVVECARAVRDGQAIESALPETLVAGVMDRVAGLSASARGYLEAGALIGGEFTAATVARVADRLPAMVIDALLPALRARLLDETVPGRYRFGHALVRDAIEARMAAEARRELHARILSVLEVQGESPDVLIERARHAIGGLGPVAPDRAEVAVQQAVAALEREGAHDRAFTVWRRWLDAGAAAPDAPAWLRLANLANLAGNHVEGHRAAQSAAAMARGSGDGRLLGEATLAMVAAPMPSTVTASHVRALEDALAQLPAGTDAPLACRLRARLAAALQPAADPSVPVAMARAVIADARAIGDPGLVREVIGLAFPALAFFVGAAEIQALCGELLALADGHVPVLLRTLARRVVCDLELGDFPAFDADAEQMLALARMAGHPTLVWRPALVGSMRALARGQFEESERFVTEVEVASTLTDDPAVPMALGAHKLHRLLALDDEPAIRTSLATAVARVAAGAGDYYPAVIAAHAVRLEDRELAAAQIPALLRLATRVPPDSPFLGGVGEAVALAGTRAQRESLFEALLPMADREVHQSPFPLTYEGPVARVLGLLEASLGRLDAAQARLDTACAKCAEHGLRPWVARLTLERARVLRARGRPEARALFEEAAALAAGLPMPGIEARARRELGQAPAPPVVTPGKSATVALVREGEVWRVTLGTQVARVKDSRGVQLLAKLVAAPGERIHALALVGEGEEPPPESDAGEALDRKALGAYRARLAMLEGVRGAPAERERRMLSAEISRAVGLGGRVRVVGSATERARINVTRRLKDAISRIRASNEEIGRHLDREVRTGTWSSYRDGG